MTCPPPWTPFPRSDLVHQAFTESLQCAWQYSSCCSYIIQCMDANLGLASLGFETEGFKRSFDTF